MKAFFLSSIIFLTFGNLEAQRPPEIAPPDFSHITWLTGKWEGKGWIIRGRDNRIEFSQTENVTIKLGGRIMTIEGLGVSLPIYDNNPVVAHNAFAVLSKSMSSNKLVMRAYSKDGKFVEADAYISEDKKFVWGFDIPNYGKVKYTIWQDENALWQEIGEFSRDGGKNWFQNFAMSLKRL